MRIFPAGVMTLLRSRRYAFAARVELTNQIGLWQDMTGFLGRNWFEQATWTEDTDTPVATGTVTLTRETAADNWNPAYNLSPLMRDNVVNQLGGTYAPFIVEGRGVRVSVAVTAPGVAPVLADYITVFVGQYDSWEVSSDANTMTLGIRDAGALVVDRFVKDRAIYAPTEGVLLETVLQQMLDDQFGAGVVPLYVPVATGTLVQNYELSDKSLLEGMRDLVMGVNGFDLRYRWDAAGAFRLTLQEPTRDAEPGDELQWFAANEYIAIPRLATSLVDVRNAVRVRFTNADLVGAPADKVDVKDDVSIAAYGGPGKGERFIGFDFSKTSNVNTTGEATALANKALHDLATPMSDHDLELFPAWLNLQVGDYVGCRANGKVYDRDTSFGVFGFTHTLQNASGSTTVQTKGKVVGGYREWTRRAGTEGGGGISGIQRNTLDNFDVIGAEGDANVVAQWAPGNAVREVWVWVRDVPFPVVGNPFDIRGVTPTAVLHPALNENAFSVAKPTDEKVGRVVVVAAVDANFQMGDAFHFIVSRTFAEVVAATFSYDLTDVTAQVNFDNDTAIGAGNGRYRLDFGAWTSFDVDAERKGTFTATALDAFEQFVEIQARDAGGFWGPSYHIEINSFVSPGPSLVVHSYPTPGFETTRVSIDWDGVGIITRRINNGDYITPPIDEPGTGFVIVRDSTDRVYQYRATRAGQEITKDAIVGRIGSGAGGSEGVFTFLALSAFNDASGTLRASWTYSGVRAAVTWFDVFVRDGGGGPFVNRGSTAEGANVFDFTCFDVLGDTVTGSPWSVSFYLVPHVGVSTDAWTGAPSEPFAAWFYKQDGSPPPSGGGGTGGGDPDDHSI